MHSFWAIVTKLYHQMEKWLLWSSYCQKNQTQLKNLSLFQLLIISCLSQLVEGKELRNNTRNWANSLDFLNFKLLAVLSTVWEWWNFINEVITTITLYFKINVLRVKWDDKGLFVRPCRFDVMYCLCNLRNFVFLCCKSLICDFGKNLFYL